MACMPSVLILAPGTFYMVPDTKESGLGEILPSQPLEISNLTNILISDLKPQKLR